MRPQQLQLLDRLGVDGVGGRSVQPQLPLPPQLLLQLPQPQALQAALSAFAVIAADVETPLEMAVRIRHASIIAPRKPVAGQKGGAALGHRRARLVALVMMELMAFRAVASTGQPKASSVVG